MRDLDVWVADILEAPDLDTLDREQAGWARSVRPHYGDFYRVEDLAAITSMARARARELNDQLRWTDELWRERLKDVRRRLSSHPFHLGPSSTELGSG